MYCSADVLLLIDGDNKEKNSPLFNIKGNIFLFMVDIQILKSY